MTSTQTTDTGRRAAKRPRGHRAGAMPFDIERWFQKTDPTPRAPIALSADGQWLAVMMMGLATDGSEAARSLPREGGMFQTASMEMAGSDIWIVERNSGKITRPFQSFAGAYGPVWSPTGARLGLALQDTPARYPRIAIWTPGDGGLTVFTNASVCPKVGFSAPCWTPDGLRIAFFRHNLEIPTPSRLVHTVLDDNGHPVPPDDRTARAETLAVLDVETGDVRSYQEPDISSTVGFRLSPDGKRVALLSGADPLDPELPANWVRLTVTNLDTGDCRTIGTAQPDGWTLSLSWAPGGRHIAWRAVTQTAPERLLIANVGADAALIEAQLPIDSKTGCPIHLPGPPSPPLWSADSAGFWVPRDGALLHVATDGSLLAEIPLPPGAGAEWLENGGPSFAPARAHQVSTTGDVYLVRQAGVDCANLEAKTVRAVLDEADITGEWKWMERAVDWTHSKLFTLHRTGNTGWELLQTRLTDGHTSRLAMLYPGLDDFEKGQLRILSWTNADGTACSGALLLPIGWKEGDRPPVVMEVYGDYRGAGNCDIDNIDRAGLVMNPCLLGLHGYAFFRPDMPQTDEEPAGSLALAGEEAADALMASGLVDADRIGVVGQSYGGYTVMCMLTASNRFKMGIAVNGIFDLTRIATEDGLAWLAEQGQGRMHATLWSDPIRYIDNSPLYALDKLQTPLLIVQGSADEVTKHQSPPVFSALKRLGKPAEMIVGTDMGHCRWSIEAQRELIPKLLGYLDKYLKA